MIYLDNNWRTKKKSASARIRTKITSRWHNRLVYYACKVVIAVRIRAEVDFFRSTTIVKIGKFDLIKIPDVLKLLEKDSSTIISKNLTIVVGNVVIFKVG